MFFLFFQYFIIFIVIPCFIMVFYDFSLRLLNTIRIIAAQMVGRVQFGIRM